MLPVSNLLEKVRKKGKGLTEDDIDSIHDNLMIEYGWIPLEEFRNIPLPTLWNLMKRINERREAEKETMGKNKPRRGRIG